MTSKQTLSLFFWVGLCLFVGFLGSFFVPGEWYANLDKSSLTPPNIVFPIVWNILFVLMGLAAWRVWSSDDKGLKKLAIAVFVFQLILNVFWSYLFFGIQRPDLALFEIIVLWVFIFLTFVLFYKSDRVAGFLFLPYFLWVSFAIHLNYSIVQLNNF